MKEREVKKNKNLRDDHNKRMGEYSKILDHYPELSSKIKALPEEYVSAKFYLMTFTPILFSFVSFVIEDANKKGLDRLYFLSRDGYQMYLIAKRIVKLLGFEIECRYLKVSRYSMRVPGYHLDIDKAIESLCTSGIDVTLKRILKRGALTEEECFEVLCELGLSDNKDKTLKYAEVMAFKDVLKKSDKLRKYISTHSKDAYDSAFAYLEQEGLLEGDYAIVDSGWVGTLQLSIERLLRSKGADIRVGGYYFGMYEYPAEIKADRTRKDKFNTFFFSPTKGLSRKRIFSNSLFEAVVTAPAGMVTGYKTIEDGTVKEIENALDPVAVATVGKRIDALKYLLEMLSSVPDINTKDVRKIIYLLMSDPTEIELEAFGNISFSDDINDIGRSTVAAKMSVAELKAQRFLSRLLIVKGIKKVDLKESAWIEGSAVRAEQENLGAKNSFKAERELRHIRFCKSMTYLRKQIKNL